MMKQYNFDIAMSANVSESVVQDMVTAIVEKQTGRQVKALKPIIVMERLLALL